MVDDNKSNLVITGDMLFHRRVDYFIRCAFEADVSGNRERYVTIVENLTCEILPRLNVTKSKQLEKSFYDALQIYNQTRISGTKLAGYKLLEQAKAFFMIKRVYSHIISEAHAQGIFLRETKDIVRAETISEYFDDAKI